MFLPSLIISFVLFLFFCKFLEKVAGAIVSQKNNRRRAECDRRAKCLLTVLFSFVDPRTACIGLCRPPKFIEHP